ncbi:nitrophenyl compound nitroreductase subunit ArsF family protein [Chloroflexota bacterium]
MKSKLSSSCKGFAIISLVMLMAILLSVIACSSTPINGTVSPYPVNSQSEVTKVSPNPTQTSPALSSTHTTSDLRVDVLYFHSNQRCATCVCFEERITHVVMDHFKNELDTGKLTYRVLNWQDKNNSDLVSKYQAVGSQLFINTIIDGTDHIVDVLDIWAWSCRSAPDLFDDKIQELIAKSLTEAT